MYEIYVIQVGDTLEGIARKYDTSVGILNQINGFDMHYSLIPGNEIIVPVMKKQP